MTDVRLRRLERYEAWAAEYEMLARVAIDPGKQHQYGRLAAHYRYLAASFRKALAMHRVVSTKSTLH
jgi:hypothetical protein